jgi:8-oxo-dGTP pyrophosphatase MutT (NUDIX family)
VYRIWIFSLTTTFFGSAPKSRTYEMVERANHEDRRVSTGVDAVILCTSIVYPVTRKSPEVLLIKQFRPPLDRYVIEFVAGLREGDESAEEAGRRELKEEVGYEYVQVNSTHGPVSLEPGISSSTASMVCLTIDGDCLENRTSNLIASPDEDEKITAYRVPFHELDSKLRELEGEGCLVAVAVWAFCIGSTTVPKSPMIEASSSFTAQASMKSELDATVFAAVSLSEAKELAVEAGARAERIAERIEIEQRSYLFSFCNFALPIITMAFGVVLGAGAASSLASAADFSMMNRRNN